MDDKKLKLAFTRVKKDIFALAGDLDKVKSSLKDLSKNGPSSVKPVSRFEQSTVDVSSDVKKTDYEIKKLAEQFNINSEKLQNLRDQVSRIESEMKQLSPVSKTDVKELDKSVRDVAKSIDKFDLKLQKSDEKAKLDSSELKIMRQNVEKVSLDAVKLDSRINKLDDRTEDFTNLVQEKVVLEVANLKQEILDDVSSRNSNAGTQEALNELSEMMQEKINLEVSALRLEFTDEIAKIYDKFFSEIIELRAEISKQSFKQLKEERVEKVDAVKVEKAKAVQKIKDIEKSKTRKEEIENEPVVISEPQEESKEGFVKKFTRWLFIDYEEEDEMQSIKDEVKDDKKDDKKVVKKESQIERVEYEPETKKKGKSKTSKKTVVEKKEPETKK